MKASITYYYALLLLLTVSLYSCGISKFIPNGEALYTGSKINIKSNKDIGNTKKISQELHTLLNPEPNSKILGIRPSLYFHYKAQKENPGFLNRWLNKKFGEDPVYLSDVNPQRIEQLMLNRLDNRGYFYSKVSSELDSTQKHAALRFHAELKQPYTLEQFKLDKDSLPIYNDISKALVKTEIKEGKRFDLELMKYERERIDQELKQKGYYNFNPDFLIFEVDTNRYDNKKFDLFLRLKKNVPKKSLVPYTIDSISVFPNFSIDTDTLTPSSTSNLKNWNLIFCLG